MATSTPTTAGWCTTAEEEVEEEAEKKEEEEVHREHTYTMGKHSEGQEGEEEEEEMTAEEAEDDRNSSRRAPPRERGAASEARGEIQAKRRRSNVKRPIKPQWTDGGGDAAEGREAVTYHRPGLFLH